MAGPFSLEVCVENAAGLSAAIKGGADRIELCAALECGGLTPSPGFIALAARAQVPVNVLIRPRAGGFCYGEAEVDAMCEDIAFCRAAGVAGVVIGALDDEGHLDRAFMERLAAAAGGLDITLHRAFDLAKDPFGAMETAIALGIGRILTSGQAVTASAGIDLIARLAERSEGRISLMPGGGVNAANAAAFLAIPGITELHSSCSRPAGPMPLALAGFAVLNPRETDPLAVRALKTAMSEM
ncbi:copper homeostasis protein CutC [Martelella alba]|uniref:PF03932 family protein CutC n=1 Tax=Martelella alba TaxID=2590451 RepID=A0A506U488_9HYPH|nr:copper homeostasis protein CutC [Martelella alba]TPW27359.1 copper homeostasis protein CutC [Martelella alba]